MLSCQKAEMAKTELIRIKTFLCQVELKPATAEKTLANHTSYALVCRIDKELPPKQVF